MKKYIIVITFCNNEEIANKIVYNLLKEKLVVGAQISKVHLKYYWNNILEECDEYKLQFGTKKRLFTKIEEEIKKVHDYEIAKFFL